MAKKSDVQLEQKQVTAVMKSLLDQGWSVLPGGRRPARFSISVSSGLNERLDMLAQLFGWSRSEAANVAILIGVSVLEDELAQAGAEEVLNER